MADLTPRDADGKLIEEGSGAPADNVHLIAHHAAVRTHTLATDLATMAEQIKKAAIDLAASAEDSKKRSFAAHKRTLENRNAPPTPAEISHAKAVLERAETEHKVETETAIDRPLPVEAAGERAFAED